MSARACVCCDKPLSAGFLCKDAVRKLEGHLRSVPALVEALEEAVTRQVQFGPGGGGSGETPLAFNASAADALAALRGFLEASAGQLADVAGQPVRWPGASQSAAYILTQAPYWQRWADVAVFYAEFAEWRGDAWTAVDRPPDPVYLGSCGARTYDEEFAERVCRDVLWAYDDASTAVCKRCGRIWSRADREAAISDRVRVGMVDRVMTATDGAEVLIAERLATGTVDHLADRIRKWGAHRPPRVGFGPYSPGALISPAELHVPGKRPRPGYRLGDVIDLLNAADARRATSTPKRKEAPMTDHREILKPDVQVQFDGLTRSWTIQTVSKDGRFAIARTASGDFTLIDHVELSRTSIDLMLKAQQRTFLARVSKDGAYVGGRRAALFVTGVKVVGAKVWA